MAVVRARNPLIWVRRALLVAGILAVLGVGLLLAAYRFGSAGQRQDAPAAARAQTDDSTVTAGQGFDYAQTSEGRRVFRIRAERSRQDRDDMAFLEEVFLEIYRDDGETYTVTSRRARVNQRNWDARLEGDVVIQGWQNLELKARAVELQNGGQVLTSVGAVEFRYPPDLIGRATSLRIDRRIDVINLSDGVHIKSVPEAAIEVRLDCERLIYRRSEALARALEDVYLCYGDQELSTRALSLFLDDDQKMKMIRARWDVAGRLLAEGDFGAVSRAEFSSQLLEVVPGPQDPTVRRMKLEGGPGSPVSVKMIDASGIARRFTGRIMEGGARAGELLWVEGFGAPLTLDEFIDLPPDEPFLLRQACAHHSIARFLPGGDLGRIDLEREIELRSPDLHLSRAERVALDLENGRLEVEGDPSVEIYSERGTITAPRFTYTEERGVLKATSGVLATLEETASLERTPLGRGRGPIRIESREALFTDLPPAYSFRGRVRAWRGQNLLLADQLRADDTQREMAASGNVKTVWFATDGAPAAAGESEAIEVTAESLSYRPVSPQAVSPQAGSTQAASPQAGSTQADGGETTTLIYSGDVLVVQEQRTIRCRELTVELAPPAVGTARNADSGEPRRMICRGEVELLDPPANRQVRGDTAIYTVARKQVEVLGDPVRLVDADRNSLVGRYLLYDLAADNGQLRSQAPASPSIAGSR